MNIALLSSNATYHHLAQLFEKESNVDNIYHFGANRSLIETDKYHPIAYDLLPSLQNEEHIAENGSSKDFDKILKDIKKIKIDFAMTSNRNLIGSQKLHDSLNELKIPCFFVYPGLVNLEKDRITAKKLLNGLKIPTPQGEIINGKLLEESFMGIVRPFVIKITSVYFHGRQTIIVDDNNYEEVYQQLFGERQSNVLSSMSLSYNSTIWKEDFIKIKREYSYHMLVNQYDWKFLGAARDYKKIYEGDIGFNTLGLGAYNITDVDPIIHEYAERIFKKIQNYLMSKGKFYRGFMYLGIAIDENDEAHVLEINIRNGEPELDAILPAVDNNLSELFYSASLNSPMPLIKPNDYRIVSIRLFHKNYDWITPAEAIPKIDPLKIPSDIICSMDGTDSNGNYFLTHSLFTAKAETHSSANKKISKYLDSLDLGQFKYRKDIGILE